MLRQLLKRRHKRHPRSQQLLKRQRKLIKRRHKRHPRSQQLLKRQRKLIKRPPELLKEMQQVVAFPLSALHLLPKHTPSL